MGNNGSKQKDAEREAAEAEKNRKVAETFKKYDRDSSGELDVNEIKKALKDLKDEFPINPSDSDVDKIIEGLDTDRSGQLSCEEFTKLYNVILESGQEIKRQFEFFDKDGDGTVTKRELKASLKELNQKINSGDIKRMLNEADVDGDGKITFEEFQEILNG